MKGLEASGTWKRVVHQIFLQSHMSAFILGLRFRSGLEVSDKDRKK